MDVSEFSCWPNSEIYNTPEESNYASNQRTEVSVPQIEFVCDAEPFSRHADLCWNHTRNPSIFAFAHQNLVPRDLPPFGNVSKQQNRALRYLEDHR